MEISSSENVFSSLHYAEPISPASPLEASLPPEESKLTILQDILLFSPYNNVKNNQALWQPMQLQSTSTASPTLPNFNGPTNISSSVPSENSSVSSNNSPYKTRKPKTTYNESQIMMLEREFAESPYVPKLRLIHLAQELHTSEKNILVWFQKRRQKIPSPNTNLDKNQTLWQHVPIQLPSVSSASPTLPNFNGPASVPIENSPVPSNNTKSGSKQPRTTFTEFQIMMLEKEFTKSDYIAKLRRIHLAKELNISEKNITVWFQNRRQKHKSHLVGVKKRAYTKRTSNKKLPYNPPAKNSAIVNRLLSHSPVINNSLSCSSISTSSDSEAGYVSPPVLVSEHYQQRYDNHYYQPNMFVNRAASDSLEAGRRVSDLSLGQLIHQTIEQNFKECGCCFNTLNNPSPLFDRWDYKPYLIEAVNTEYTATSVLSPGESSKSDQGELEVSLDWFSLQPFLESLNFEL